MLKLAYFQIMGKPLIFWTGIMAILLLILAALVPFLNKKGIKIIPYGWHQKIAAIAILFAIFHGIMGLSAYI